jgi:hypothetical protein
MDDDFAIILELSLFGFNIKKDICDVFDYILLFLKKYEETNSRNMFSLILGPQFKNLHLVFSFVGREQGIFIVE